MRRTHWIRAAGIIIIAIIVMVAFNDVPAPWVWTILIPAIVILTANNPQPVRSARFNVIVVIVAVSLMVGLVVLLSVR